MIHKTSPKLKCDTIELNAPKNLNILRRSINKEIQKPKNYFKLHYQLPNYFKVLDGDLPEEAGWYVILDNKIPLYVGKANNLNKRLNSLSGSSDDFGKKNRTSDVHRNFIKKYHSLKIFKSLSVCVISESKISKYLKIPQAHLTKRDQNNVEKVINIFRGHFKYK